MSKDNLNFIFKNIEGQFDIEEPTAGHKQRFLDKLNHQNTVVVTEKKSVFILWKPILSVAASIVLLLTISLGVLKSNNASDLASISPEMATTQDFFTTTITTELNKLNSEESPEYQDLIVDTMFQIKILEENYEQLKQDLSTSGQDERVIYAMISNFQNRIELLQNVVAQINDLKQPKNEQNEHNNTL
ncbi:hypothetical protein [Pontimicrobium aquaticum]|uniref:DUF4179 domain-containing protein n=1 Tax=Pontimicrobium aquaticum TaxID=2565367 RepID=A0A4V5LQ62_9FLAO|nr:hypothetical protein [Pontimicrobium aquaticum]TJY34039.1 hypothetical protein E5167_12030 [Pontimicrobium aquaticum]